MNVESILLIWPAPIPKVCWFFEKTIALDLTNLETVQENFKSKSSSLVGFFFETISSIINS